MEAIIVAYIPVIHAGYLAYLSSVPSKRVYALEASDVPELPHLVRENRALSVSDLANSLKFLGYDVRPFRELLAGIAEEDPEIYIPEDDATRAVYERLLKGRRVVFGNAFLRWDWSKSTAVSSVLPEADRVVRKGDDLFLKCSERMARIFEIAKRSSDWWRQVGCVIEPKNGPLIITYNKHFPNEYAPYFDGDPRSSFNPGEFIEISTALHSEIAGIAEAARRGITLEGAEISVTVFPCSGCASCIPEAGIERVFFTGGYSNLNGYRTLKSRSVELVYVEL